MRLEILGVKTCARRAMVVADVCLAYPGSGRRMSKILPPPLLAYRVQVLVWVAFVSKSAVSAAHTRWRSVLYSYDGEQVAAISLAEMTVPSAVTPGKEKPSNKPHQTGNEIKQDSAKSCWPRCDMSRNNITRRAGGAAA
jgi:hypothetical protein